MLNSGAILKKIKRVSLKFQILCILKWEHVGIVYKLSIKVLVNEIISIKICYARKKLV